MSSLGSDSEYVTTSDEPVNTDILAENPPTTNEPEAVDQMGFENVEVVDQQAGDGLDNLATFDKPVTLDNAEPVPVDVDNVELNEVDLLGVNWTINRVQELRRNTATFQKEVVPAVGMSVPFSNTKLRVPKGFQNILEGLAREVLRSQPGNIYEFGANYFEHMLKIRDEEGIDPAKHGAQMEDRFYNNKAFKEPDVDPADPQQQDAAKAIQTKYRQHQAKQLVEGLREEQAAVRIQAGYRGFKDRERVLEMRDPDEYNRRVAVREARIAARGMRPTDSALAAVSGDAEEEVDIDLTDPDVEQAAIKIQAGFKGFKARQEVQKMKVDSSEPVAISDPTVNDEEEVDIDLNDPEVEKATIKIQAGFKGMQARKAVKERREELAHQGESDTQASEGTVQEAPLEQAPPGSSEPQKQEDEEVDIDLNDPDVQQATLKIQAGFKGMKARKQVKEMKVVEEVPLLTKQYEPKPVVMVKEMEAVEVVKCAAPQMELSEEEEEEEIDIDLDDPEVEKAAVKIQAGFKGFKARKEIMVKKDVNAHQSHVVRGDDTVHPSEQDEIDIDLTDPDVEKAAVKIQAGFKGFKTRREVQAQKESHSQVQQHYQAPTGQEEEIDIDLTDPEVEKAAVKIQAGFKGFKTRREINSKQCTTSPATKLASNVEDSEEVDIDLNDPEVERAAVKIQAGFKGFKTRREIEASRVPVSTNDSPTEEDQEVIDIDLDDPEVERAAIKIQAGFKNFKVHKSKEVNAAADETPSAEESKPAEETKPVEETKSEEQAKPEEPKEEEEIDIDLNDPKVADATVKIQAGFKGMKARKEVKEKRSLIESQKSGTGPSEVAGEGEGSTDKVAEETEPTTTQSTEEAEPTTTQSTEEAEPTTTQSTEQVEPTTTQSTEEAKPTTEKPEEEAEPTAENTTEEAEPTEEKPQGDEQS